MEPARSILKRSALTVWTNKKVFSIILAFYGLAYILAVESSTSVTNASTTLSHYESIYRGSAAGLFSGLSTFTNLFGSLSGANSPTSGAYQTILFISLSLVIIWCAMQLAAKRKFNARDAFYSSHTPLIKFFLILLLIGLEFTPFLIGASLYNNIFLNGPGLGGAEAVLWVLIIAALAVISLFFLTSTIFALYLVNEGLTPMQAVRAARGYVRKRRIVVFGKILLMPVTIFIAIGIIMLPVIYIIPVAAVIIMAVLLLIGITIFHCYMYNLSQVIKR